MRSVTRNGDPLLGVVRIVLTALLGLSIAGVAAIGLLLPVMFARRGEMAARLARQGFEAASVEWLAVLLLLIAAMTALAFFFLRHLRRIVDTVLGGEPFVPANAGHLRHMAWLVLAIQVLAVPMTGLAVWFDAAPFKPNVHHGSNGISMWGLVLALVLFVLARVFRVGSEMRDELEGTI
jgi:hypothetical protein